MAQSDASAAVQAAPVTTLLPVPRFALDTLSFTATQYLYTTLCVGGKGRGSGASFNGMLHVPAQVVIPGGGQDIERSSVTVVLVLAVTIGADGLAGAHQVEDDVAFCDARGGCGRDEGIR